MKTREEVQKVLEALDQETVAAQSELRKAKAGYQIATASLHTAQADQYLSEDAIAIAEGKLLRLQARYRVASEEYRQAHARECPCLGCTANRQQPTKAAN